MLLLCFLLGVCFVWCLLFVIFVFGILLFFSLVLVGLLLMFLWCYSCLGCRRLFGGLLLCGCCLLGLFFPGIVVLGLVC